LLLGRTRVLAAQAAGGLPEAQPGKQVRVCAGADEPHLLDLRAIEDAAGIPDGVDADASLAAVAQTGAALAGAEPACSRAAAAAALLLHAATGEPPPAAYRRAQGALAGGAARAIADRLPKV
jgi:hypothetical protein